MERFWSKVDRTGECWNWTGCTDKDGYGRFWWDSKERSIAAPRAAIMVEGGDIPSGMMVCHTCDNRLCVNPNHLYLGNAQSNMSDKMQRGRHKVSLGSKNGKATLDESTVKSIRRRYANGEKQADIMRDLGISRQLVHDIVRRRSWKHI